MCQKWFVKFRAGDLPLGDAPQLGRPVEVDSKQIKTLTGNDQCYTTQEIAYILKIPKSMKLLVRMKNIAVYVTEKNSTDFLASPVLWNLCPHSLTSSGKNSPSVWYAPS